MNIFPKDSIPAKMLADLKNLIKRNAKFDKKTLLGLIPLLILHGQETKFTVHTE